MRCVLVGLVLAAVAAGPVHAMTADGTLVTNVASGTFQSAGAVKFFITYAATAWVIVANPNIQVWKSVTPTVQAAGGDVVFQICALNTSASTSAFNVTLTGQLPSGMSFQAVSSVWNGGIGAWQITNSNSLSGPWAAGWPAVNTVNPLFLRWTMQVVGPLDSACVSYTARVL
jgi:uncharacterized repeat protein (TIGR01451 family)